MASPHLVDVLQQEVGALSAEVARLRLMVHRVTRGAEKQPPPPKNDKVTHRNRSVRDGEKRNRNNIDHIGHSSQEILQLLRQLLHPPNSSYRTSTDNTEARNFVRSISIDEESSEKHKKIKRKKEKSNDRVRDGDRRNNSKRRKKKVVTPSEFSSSEAAMPPSTRLTAVRNIDVPLPDEQSNDKRAGVKPATRQQEAHRVTTTPKETVSVVEQSRGPKLESGKENVSQFGDKGHYHPPSEDTISIPRDDFLCYDDDNEESIQNNGGAKAEDTKEREMPPHKNLEDELPVGTEWVATGGEWMDNESDRHSSNGGVFAARRGGPSNHQDKPNNASLANADSRMEETHSSPYSHDGTIQHTRGYREVDGTRGKTQFVPVDLVASRQVKRRTMLSRLRDTSDMSDASNEDFGAKEPSPAVQQSGQQNFVVQEEQKPACNEGLEAQETNDAHGEGESAPVEPAANEVMEYDLDIPSDCDFSEDVVV
uniref:Uncharacterized protein n=1 Tax=Trypanosoma congolense (strain IL3000) TaxID=1068625 RepID=G0UX91_TRYCI|nr:conserved hypothetical protein [Trypanosoma congolense IL3000]